ncbi:MAG TPA: aldose 1-epimerase family protein [Firmicutes bacterium]|nr:aldose 1-epimerase family protein [Bacillota bacterium]
MANLFGRKWTREELLSYVGDIQQIGGVRRFVLQEGREAGVEIAQFRTGTGFNFDVVLSRALDISLAEYQGQPLAWRSSTGVVGPWYYEPEGQGWLRSFAGGLLATCGLRNIGPACIDEGEALGQHGRIGNIPAENIWVDGAWDGDEYVMWAQGKIRETTVFGENLLLTRRISTRLGENRVWIDDVVENEGADPSPFMLLYHVNLGFPVVADGAELLKPPGDVVPRDADAEEGKEFFASFHAPQAGYREKVYWHYPEADAYGYVTAAIVNRRHNNGQGLGVYVRYKKEQLPYLVEWKMMGERTYVVGLEPANSLVEGRAKERERGTLQYLAPGEARRFRVEIGVLPNLEAIEDLARKLR